jgi:hypothetical protein
MSHSRIVYQNWIVDLGHDPGLLPGQGSEPIANNPRAVRIEAEVCAALESLTSDEREFIVRFFFMGESYRVIAEQSGRAIHKLEALHKRCLRKLRSHLAAFVDTEFGLVRCGRRSCPICRSPRRGQIDCMVVERDRSATWRPVMKRLREEFAIDIKSPQTLIGHEKYH